MFYQHIHQHNTSYHVNRLATIMTYKEELQLKKDEIQDIFSLILKLNLSNVIMKRSKLQFRHVWQFITVLTIFFFFFF